MRGVEIATWMLIGGVTLAFMRVRHRVALVKKKPALVFMSSEREIDPRRWAHNGSQPIAPILGNRERNVNLEVKHLQELLD